MKLIYPGVFAILLLFLMVMPVNAAEQGCGDPCTQNSECTQNCFYCMCKDELEVINYNRYCLDPSMPGYESEYCYCINYSNNLSNSGAFYSRPVGYGECGGCVQLHLPCDTSEECCGAPWAPGGIPGGVCVKPPDYPEYGSSECRVGCVPGIGGIKRCEYCDFEPGCDTPDCPGGYAIPGPDCEVECIYDGDYSQEACECLDGTWHELDANHWPETYFHSGLHDIPQQPGYSLDQLYGPGAERGGRCCGDDGIDDDWCTAGWGFDDDGYCKDGVWHTVNRGDFEGTCGQYIPFGGVCKQFTGCDIETLGCNYINKPGGVQFDNLYWGGEVIGCNDVRGCSNPPCQCDGAGNCVPSSWTCDPGQCYDHYCCDSSYGLVEDDTYCCGVFDGCVDSRCVGLEGDYFNPTYYFYDGLGRLIQTRQRNSDDTKTIVGSIKYNDMGQKHHVSKPYEDTSPADTYIASDWGSLIAEHNVTIYNEYDGLGRIKEVINPDDSRVKTTYGPNWIQIEDEEGKVTKSYYNAFDNLVKVTDANNQDTYYTYDILGNLLTIIDPKGHMIDNTYNSLGWLISTAHPDRGLTSCTYDRIGNVKTKTDANGNKIVYEYDDLNRLIKIDYPTCTDVIKNYDEATSNGIGRLTSVIDTFGKNTYYYDDRGRLKKEIKTIDGTSYTTTYDYDSADNMIRLVDPIGRATTYDYNKLNQIQSVNINNLLQNPGFENDLINWEIQGDPQPDIVETVLNPKKFGDKAVHIKIDKRSIWSGIRSVEVPLQPNMIYTISAWIYVPNDFTAWCEWGEWGEYYCTDQDYTTPPRQRRCSIVGEDCNDYFKIVYDCFDAGDTYCKYNPNGPWYCRARPCVKKSSGNLICGYWELHRHAYNADRSNPHSYTIIGGDYTWDNNVPRDQWIRKYITIKTEPDVVSGRVFIITLGDPGSTGEVYIDGIQVEAGDTATLFSSVSYNYNPSGTINLINFPNSLETSYTYTPRDWAEKIDTNYFYQGSPIPIFSRYYEYDNLGDLKNLYTSPGNLIAQFNYDNLDRLTGVTDYDYFGKNIEYTYDRSGNRQDITFTFPGPFSSLLRYHYDSGTNKLTKITDISGGLPLAYFHYDANGNLIDKSCRNLLGNPSFESGVGTDAFLWGVVGVDPTKNVRSSDKSHSGRYSIKSTFTSPGGPDVATITTDFIPVEPNTQYVATITTDFIPVEPNTQYTVSGWVYNSLSSGNAYLDFDDGHGQGGDFTDCHADSTTGNNAWERVGCTITTGPATTGVRIRAVTDGTIRGIVWFDDIQLEAGTVLTDYSTTSYVYDEENRLVRVSFPDGKENKYVYDAEGKRVKKIDGSGITTYIYDQTGNVIFTALQILPMRL